MQSRTYLVTGASKGIGLARGADASFPGKLVSVDLGVRGARAELYVGWAGIDPFAPQEQMAPFTTALHEAGVAARVELYPNVWHGFAFPERLVYNEAAAELHWKRLLDLFRRRLPTNFI